MGQTQERDEDELPFPSTRPGSPPEETSRMAGPHQRAGRCVESSWDLQRGLTVREGLPDDAGLDEWIDALLRS